MAPARILTILIVLGILGFSVNFAIDPKESENQKRDEAVSTDAGSIVEAINGYYEKYSKFIWGTTALDWTKAEDLKLQNLVETEFLLNVPKSAQDIYVGRGSSKEDKVWACFAPISKHERADPIKLRNITPGEKLPAGGVPNYCENKPDWQSSFCFTCVSE